MCRVARAFGSRGRGPPAYGGTTRGAAEALDADGGGACAFEGEEVCFCLQAAAEAGEVAIRADDAVAGGDDRDRVAAVGGADRATAVGWPICLAIWA